MEYKVYKDASGFVGVVEYVTENITYTIAFCNDELIHVSDGVRDKWVAVKEDSGWSVCAQKTQIKARGGAAGLLKHFSNELWRFQLRDLVEHALNNMKGLEHVF